MRRRYSLGLAGLVAAALVSAPARADNNGPPEQGAEPEEPPQKTASGSPQNEPTAPSPLPQEGAGLLGVLGGVRYTFPSTFAQGTAVTSHTVGPAVIMPFLYQVDRSWAIMLELGYATDQFTLNNGMGLAGVGTLRSQTVTIQMGAQWTPHLGWSRVQPYLGAGLGYYLSTLSTTNWASTETVPSESNTTGIFLSLGCRIALTSRVGLLVEDRYALASTGAGSLGTISVGGNTAALGMYVVWKE